MEASFQPLLDRLDRLPDEFREIRDAVRKVIRVADLAPDLALVPPRKVLDAVIREVYQRRCDEPPGSRPLEGLIQQLVKKGYFPPRLEAYADAVRGLGNVGAHQFGGGVTTADVERSLSQLIPILEWYVEVERPDAAGRPPAPAHPPSPEGGEPPGRRAAARPAFPVAVVPKGLRAFDAADARFFLDLLPGPRGEDGLPETIRFWKRRVETDDEPTFTVGVIYGPSGSGKSSLVKAGLLPRLAPRVQSVYVEATAQDTEARLVKALRRRFPEMSEELDLPGLLGALRRGKGLEGGRKALVVIDQFEQWLHARRQAGRAELTQALRQCDGERLQCVVLVRDDFWLGVSRFMADLEIGLVQGENTALVDLFDPLHARRVLAAFGRAFGRLPEGEPAKEQEKFLDEAVVGLTRDGRVIPVRLALFAEMVKAKPWTPAALKEVGGTEGVGATFLEETFCSPIAEPRNRLHRKAAQAVLKALLPEQGTDIKGNLRTREELLAASGYADRPKEFEDLLRLLDAEVRLITPADPDGAESEEGSERKSGGKCYQLTHDYLVSALRGWLARKQRESRRGRAELRLAERAAVWDARPENRRLPAWWEWAAICLYTRRDDWTPTQRKMMRAAGRHHAVRGLALAVLFAIGFALCGWVVEQNRATEAAGLVHRLLDADLAKTPAIIAEMRDCRRWTDPLLRDAAAEADRQGQPGRRLRASLGLLPVDRGQVDYLYRRLLDAEPDEAVVLRDALAGHKDELDEGLWKEAQLPARGREKRFLCAASALAAYAPDDPRWETVADEAAKQLASVSPFFIKTWTDALWPVRGKLVAPLSAVFRDPGLSDLERSNAGMILSDYAADQPVLLADLLLDADVKQFAVLFPKGDAARDEAAAVWEKALSADLDADKTQEGKERLAKRQANAGAALLRVGRAEKVWPLLKHTPDPRARSYLVHRFAALGVDPNILVKRLGQEKVASIRRALLMSLGEFDPEQLKEEERERFTPAVLSLYREDPDAGLHGAAEWLLRQWNRGVKIKEIDQERARDSRERETKLREIHQALAKGKDRGESYWYVNGEGQTMVALPGPMEFLMGSPPAEVGREGGPKGPVEAQHAVRIGRTFAIAAKEVTVEQFLRFREDHEYRKEYTPTTDCPVNDVTWYDAAAYCNWLSQQENIPPAQWCYQPNAKGAYAEGMTMASDYLQREGYRLPTEAEWEFACRARARTSRYYGETNDLLGKYAWCSQNALYQGLMPGGGLKPNDFGLFDLLGNAMEWCQDRKLPAPHDPPFVLAPGDDVEDAAVVVDKEDRIMRGGSFSGLAVLVRSAYRGWIKPTVRNLYVGFRPARTIR